MNIIHISSSDENGGASRAAYRIHRSLLEHGEQHGIQSQMRVIAKHSDDPTVLGGMPAVRRSLWRNLQRQQMQRDWQRFQTGNPVLHSMAWPATGLGTELENTARSGGADLLHLHWLGDQTLSIEEIGTLSLPLVWTLHDQWAFCGAEHYTMPPGPSDTDSRDDRFVQGYTPHNRPTHEAGPDINRQTWQRKQRSWKRPFPIVCPSQWLADCARRSALMADWPITVIPNPIDLAFWAPVEQRLARSLLQLPQEVPLVLFGAINAGTDHRKGSDLLADALRILHPRCIGTALQDLELVVYGQSRPPHPPDLGFKVHYTGSINDDLHLRLLYAAADVFVIPSRQDNLPNTGLEAHSCGTPVVAFAIGGLVDIVDDRVTGALAEPFDPSSLAAAIRWVLEDPQRRSQLAENARKKAERLWNPIDIAKQYELLYQEPA